MILFTSGFPGAGKTRLAEKLTEALDNKLVLHIDPRKYYPDEYDSLHDHEKTEVGIAAWELSIERATESIYALPNKALIIFDTCCNNADYMEPLITSAKEKGHTAILVYVNTSLNKRLERSDGSVDLAELEERYREGFIKGLPSIRAHADHFFVVNNDKENEEGLIDGASNLAEKIKGIRDD